MTILLFTVFIALGISFLCSVMEACLLSVSLADIGRLSEKKPAAGNIWKHFRDNIEKPITVILIINTLAHTIGAALSGAKFEELFGPKWIIAFSVIFSLVMIQWTEILPKTLGVRYNRKVAEITALPLKYLIRIFSPFVSAVQFLNRPFEGKKRGKAETAAAEEISVLARFAELNNLINRDQQRILSHTVNLANIKVRDVMVTKEEIKFLSTRMSLSEALIEAHIHHHTRFPLINGSNEDEVIGYVNFKDIVSALQTNPKDPSLKGICRPILETEGDEPIPSVLGKLKKSYQHIAVVRDRSGKISGIITLEDIVEAVMGDNIEDEYDIMPDYIYKIADDRYVAGGGVDLKKLGNVICGGVPKDEKNLNQWLIGLFGRVPRAEERIQYGNCTFITRKIRRSNIYEVIVQTFK